MGEVGLPPNINLMYITTVFNCVTEFKLNFHHESSPNKSSYSWGKENTVGSSFEDKNKKNLKLQNSTAAQASEYIAQTIK